MEGSACLWTLPEQLIFNHDFAFSIRAGTGNGKTASRICEGDLNAYHSSTNLY
jgi:hypothetical protein